MKYLPALSCLIPHRTRSAEPPPAPKTVPLVNKVPALHHWRKCRLLQKELKFSPGQAAQIKSRPAQKTVWAELEVIQPERCIIELQSPQRDVNAKYFGGNRLRICCCGRSCTR
jgi:hypothetical protein